MVKVTSLVILPESAPGFSIYAKSSPSETNSGVKMLFNCQCESQNLGAIVCVSKVDLSPNSNFYGAVQEEVLNT